MLTEELMVSDVELPVAKSVEDEECAESELVRAESGRSLFLKPIHVNKFLSLMWQF